MQKTTPVEIIRPYIRNGNFPIDKTTLFFSYDEAVEYAHNNKTAYASQIITVDDKENKLTGVYKLDYDPNGNYNFVLAPIGIGDGSGNKIFNLKGSIANLPELYEVLAETGDMWYVLSEREFYIAMENPETEEIDWKPLALGIEYADKYNDGILSKEQYSTLINEHNEDAIAFSKSNNPTENTWKKIERTPTEGNTNYSIPSVGRVKQLIGTFVKTTGPHCELLSNIPTDSEINVEIHPRLSLKYYKEFGGDINAITLWAIFSGAKHKIFEFNNFEINDIHDMGEYSYFEFPEEFDILQQTIGEYKYEVEVSYKETDDMEAGVCTNELVFKFYKKVIYGTNLENYSTLLITNNPILLSIDPLNSEEKINTIFIKIPTPNYLDKVTYVPMNDKYAKSLFSSELIQENGVEYAKYQYQLSPLMSFESQADYIFYLK